MCAQPNDLCWGALASSDLGDEEPQEPQFKSNHEHIASYTFSAIYLATHVDFLQLQGYISI